MPRIRILDAAAQEAAEAAAWYERQRPGLGAEFNRAIETALDLLEDEVLPLSPVVGKAAQQGAKRIILKRFPYDVVVRETPDEVIVLAFSHHSRRPGYWTGRQ